MKGVEKKIKYWLFPAKPTLIWDFFSRVVIFIIFLLCKLSKGWLNTYKIYNHEKLLDSVYKRKEGRGLVTVSNHDSCIDDPLLWGALKWRSVFNYKGLRWILAADDICYTKYWHALFFSLGRVVPVTRGEGVYQRSMDFILKKIDDGGWTHIFPEGKVNLEKTTIRYKWGVARFVAEAQKMPIVLPMYHIGMDDVLPNRRPYIPQVRKKITLLVGQPMDFLENDIELLRSKRKSSAEIRKYITDKIQDEMRRLKEKAEQLHKESFPTKS